MPTELENVDAEIAQVTAKLAALQAKRTELLGGASVAEVVGLAPADKRPPSAGRRATTDDAKADDKPDKPKSARTNPADGTADNMAFVFIKPHAVTDKTKTLVTNEFKARGITVLAEGAISSKDIDEKKLIDQHYYAIASKATLLEASTLSVPEDKFKEFFAVEWNDVKKAGTAVNAVEACAKFGLDAAGLQTEWKKAKAVKFGGGFYCAKIDTVKDKPALYVFNAFFLGMRASFVAPGASIYYYSVAWPSSKLSWKSFRGEVLGPTDPANAPKDSIRGKILAQWQDLGLQGAPNGTDNGVHASASPFEGLAERCNWLAGSMPADGFGKQLVAAGLKPEMIKDWSVDCRVKLPGGGEGSIFDTLEDTNCADCLAKCVALAAANVNTGDAKL